uniref:Structural maintenance of chromosomes protein 1B-like n=1 Tax=Sinocyclocheilus rhinocerous TaxID=307959 RepID=A0A673MTU6_9TELE
MGFLKQLDVENFKSWRGKQTIGPFKRFNCIIGTNGSGKSNVMDALGFVMGERAVNLRVKHTRDLIHGAHIGKPSSTFASVSMIYSGEDWHCGESKELSGVSGASVGAVESIAMMNAKERTKMFERISSSGELSAEYDAKLAALQKAKEDTQFHFNRKKAATAEKKQVFKDKTEALVDEHRENKLQLTLFQLFHNEKKIDAQSESLRDMQDAAAQQKNSLDVYEQTVKAQKKEHGRMNRELQQLEKEIRSQEQILNQQRPQYIKAKVNTSHHEQKVEEAHRSLQKNQSQQAKKEQELQELRSELAELEKAWKASERQMEEEAAQRGDGVQLEESQMERYKELKELARKKGAVLNQSAEKLHWEVKADCEKLQFDLRRKSEIQANIKHSQTRLEDFSRRAEKLEEFVNTTRKAIEEQRQQEEQLAEELVRGQVRMEEVNAELAQVLTKLQNARLDSQENRRQQRRDEVLESLRRLYPDTVYGRLVDLCQPIHKKYQVAVTKVFGKNMNAIVVTSAKVAHDCIRFLKEERAEPETFLPIDYIDVRPLNERLREVQGAKLVVDVVQCAQNAPQLKRVIQYVCGNSLVCETLKDARRIAFDGPERLQQYFGPMRLVTLGAQSQGNQTRLKYSNSELDSIRKKSIPACQAEISKLRSELSNLEAQIEIQTESVELKDNEMKAVRDKINQLEDVVFAYFCAEIGVANIREYEQDYLRMQQELEKKRLQFESQHTRLSIQIEYEQAQLEKLVKQMKKIKETIEKEENVVISLKEVEDRLLIAVEETQSNLIELNNQLSEKTTLVKDAKTELDKTLKGLQEKSKVLVKIQKETICSEAALEQLRLSKHNLLLACKIDEGQIYLKQGSTDYSLLLFCYSASQSISTLDIYEREAQMVFDYSTMDSGLKAITEESEVEAELEKLKEGVSSLESMIMMSRAPNLKALEKIREVKDSFREVMDAFETSTHTTKKCSQEFEQVKSKRFHLFSQCFEHVSVIIDQIYKKLCRNTSAQAILSAENPNEPYLDGINYNCVAPGKRFMAMDNLSGGEKAIAALALVFAIHSFRPAPFFVLDEVDAALDNTNIGKVTGFFRMMSRESCQIIVISLKEEFYSRADALLGVYSMFDECMFSRLLTLDLTPYPLNEENATDREKDK